MRHFFGCLVLVILSATAARATVVIPADLTELANNAQWIVRGEVVDVSGQWADNRRAIETVVTLQVEAALKGSPGETVTFRVAGGTLGRYRSIVVGAPEFAVGQRVIVFLGANGPIIPYLVGFHQGVYRISSTTNGTTVVMPPADAASTAPDAGRGAPTRVPVPLNDFERRVRTLTGDVQ